MKKILVSMSVLLGIVGISGVASAAPKNTQGSWEGTFKVRDSQAMISSCSNSTGNQITFTGTVFTIGGIVTKMTATNNLKGTKGFYVMGQAQVDLDFTDPAPVTFEKRGSVDGGVGGNPWIGFYYTNPPASDDIVLGRCVQGVTKNVDRDGVIQNALKLTIATSECSPSKTTVNSYHGNNDSGVNGKIFLTNSTNNYRHYDNADGILSAGIVNVGGLTLSRERIPEASPAEIRIFILKLGVAERNSSGNLKWVDPTNDTIEVAKNYPGARLKASSTKITLNNLGVDGYAGRCRDLM